MTTFFERVLRSSAIPVLLLLGARGSHAQPSLLVYDWNLGLGPAGNVDYVKSLGYSGLVTRLKDPADLLDLEQYVEHVAKTDDFEFIGYVAYDFTNPASPQLWRDALPWLARAGSPLLVVVKKAPSQLAVEQLLEQMAEESQALGVPTVVYPHWNTDIETAAEASALIRQIGHPNLRNSIHTCHEIRGGNQDDLGTVVADHADETALVAIAGADENAYAGPFTPFVNWSDAIKPLAKGDFSLQPFLQALHDSGFDGPVLLQTYGITNDPDHLKQSLRKYAEYTCQIERRGK